MPRPADPGTHWLLRQRVPLLVAIGLATLAIGSQLPRLRFDFSPQQLFETTRQDEVSRQRQEAVELFGYEDNTLFVVLDAGPGGDALTADARQWLGRLGEAFETAEFVIRVTSISSVATIRPTADGDVEVPLAAELDREALLADPLLRGSLISRDGRLAVAAIDFADSHRRIEGLFEAVGAVRAWIAEHPPPAGIRARLTGIPFVRVDVVESIQRDQVVFMPLVTLLVGVFLFLTFRRLSRVLIPMLVVGLASAWGLAMMAVFDVPVDIINHVLPSLVTVIAVSDGLHLVVRDQEESAAGLPRRSALSVAVRTLAAACLLTSVTTAVGFASLATSGTAILVRFGLSVAAAVMMGYVLTLGVLPQLLSFTGSPRSGVRRSRRLGGFAAACGRVGIRRPWLTCAAGLALAGVLAAIGLARVQVNIRLTEVYPDDHPTAQLQRIVDESLGGILTLDVIVTVPGGRGHLQPDVLRGIAELQDRIVDLPGIASVRSPIDFLERLHAALAGPLADRLPNSRELAAQEWLLAEMGGEDLPLERLIAHDGRELRLLVRTADAGGRQALLFAEWLDDAAAEIFAARDDVQVHVTGESYVASRNMTRLIHDLFFSLALASAVIFVCLLAMFRSLRQALISILPNAFPLLAVLGYMGAVGMELDVTNVIVFSVCLGLAVDDTIHVIARFREELARGGAIEDVLERTLRGSGQAVVLTSLLLGAGFLVLTTSEFVPTQRFGYLAAITFVAALFADLVLLPALLRIAYGGHEDPDLISPSNRPDPG